MQNFLNSPAGSWLKVFVSGILGLVLTNVLNGADIFSMDWKSILSGGIASVIPVIINWLNPNDTRYGSNKNLDSK